MTNFYRIVLLSLIITSSCQSPKTEVILLGTVHTPVPNFNQDTLYNILQKIKPDVVLFEVDSTFFDADFNFKNELNDNEYFATVKYLKNNLAVVRPYDFTGRNRYRIEIGSRPTDSYTINVLDSLFKHGLMNEKHAKIYTEFNKLNDLLNQKAVSGALAFNNDETDSIAALRQEYHYNKLLQIVNETPIFDSLTVKKPNDTYISYRDGYTLAGDFWDKRNNAMANHILYMTQEFKGKRIVVLNGFFHRYYLTKLLKPNQIDKDFILKELKEFY